MELFVYNSAYEPEELIPTFKSAVWTERHRGPGDFELELESSEYYKDLLQPFVMVGLVGSPRIMEILTVKDTVNDDGEHILLVKGIEASNLLKYRVCRELLTPTIDNESWVFLNKKPLNLLVEMTKDVLLLKPLTPEDSLSDSWIVASLAQSSSYKWPYPTSTIPVNTTNLSRVEVPIDSLQNVISSFTDMYPEIGYRLFTQVRSGDVKLIFQFYTGVDRTYGNHPNPIVFNLNWGSLTNINTLTSYEDYYNAAIIFSKYGTASVYDNAEINSRGGYNRRVLPVVVNQTEDMEDLRGAPLTTYLQRVGRQALAEHKSVNEFDGEVAKHIPYVYGVDYNVGDLVTMVGSNGEGAIMRISEHIHVEDSAGSRSYPTFELVEATDPDSWSGLIDNQIWQTMPGYWNTY